MNTVGGSFCWNYTTNPFQSNCAGDNVYYIYAGFEVVLYAAGMLVDLSVAITYVTVSVAIM